MMGRVRVRLIALLLVVAGSALGACSHSTGSNAPLVKRHGAGEGAAAAGHAAAADAGPTDMVSAVSSGGSDNGPVALKFQLGQRPEPGKPLVITLRLVANRAMEHLEARFHADDGLTVSQGGEFNPQDHLDAGATLDHNLTLTPDHEGVFTVMATVTTGEAGDALSRSFVIPIVVAAPAAAPGITKR